MHFSICSVLENLERHSDIRQEAVLIACSCNMWKHIRLSRRPQKNQLMGAADSPVQNAPSHGQQSVIHSQGIIHTVAGLYEERGDGEADQRAGDSCEFYMATHTTP